MNIPCMTPELALAVRASFHNDTVLGNVSPGAERLAAHYDATATGHAFSTATVPFSENSASSDAATRLSSSLHADLTLMHPAPESSLASQPSPTAQLPPELLLKIIHATLTSALLSTPLVVHGQFSQLPASCSGCVYRRLACVSRLWRSLAREIRCKNVVLAAAGCGSAERDEQVLKRLEAEPARALGVRTIDGSLRGAHGGWIPVPAPAVGDGGETDDGFSGTEAGVSGVTTGQARWERWHEQCMARWVQTAASTLLIRKDKLTSLVFASERVRFLRIVSLCTQLTAIDIDLGFFHDVATTHAHVLPTSIRQLTLRNAGAVDTFTILRRLPRLERLTLRLALCGLSHWLPPAGLLCKTDALTRRDWRLPLDARGVDSTNLPSLHHFELSTTAFGKPCRESIRILLGNSRDTLSSLTFRNKAASEESLKAFRLVAADVMQEAAPRLEELAITDLPRHRNVLIGSSPGLIDRLECDS